MQAEILIDPVATTGRADTLRPDRERQTRHSTKPEWRQRVKIGGSTHVLHRISALAGKDTQATFTSVIDEELVINSTAFPQG